MTYVDLLETLRILGLVERAPLKEIKAMQEFYEQNPEACIRRQFAEDPLWGKG